MSNNKGLAYGLNARNKRRKGGGLSGFGGDSSDESASGGANEGGAPGASTTRSDINKAIAAEQAALRKRAQDAMNKSSLDSAVYDYDAEFDSFSSGKKKEEEARAAKAAAAKKRAPGEKVAPRYISNLLQTAQRRNQEQEIIHERKVAKEQAEEDAALRYEGKEKFVTSSYKRKLAEREQWAKEEEARAKKEEEEDVTKKTGVGSFMFGGIGRSMLMGGGRERRNEEEEGKPKAAVGGVENSKEGDDRGRGDYQHRESSSQRYRESRRGYADEREPLPPSTAAKTADAPKEAPKEKTRGEILEERAIKIREARGRYFQRRGITTQ
ncbi:hypothetical protein ACHAXT_006535 [Thalassiosira profunda]